jgi:hypothetical protein
VILSLERERLPWPVARAHGNNEAAGLEDRFEHRKSLGLHEDGFENDIPIACGVKRSDRATQGGTVAMERPIVITPQRIARKGIFSGRAVLWVTDTATDTGIDGSHHLDLIPLAPEYRKELGDTVESPLKNARRQTVPSKDGSIIESKLAKKKVTKSQPGTRAKKPRSPQSGTTAKKRRTGR